MGEVLPGHMVRPALSQLQLSKGRSPRTGRPSPSPLHLLFGFFQLTLSAQEHVVQWHPTILTKLALVPQNLLNSYGVDIPSRGGKEVMYKEGEFVVRLVGCELDQARYCEKEFDMYYQQWKSYLNKGTL